MKKKNRNKRKLSRSRRHQSAVLPVLDGKIMIITARRSGRWVIPKGRVEPDLSPRKSAAKEAWEEAGILGRVKKKRIGTYEYQKWGGTYHVEVFPMEIVEVKKKWPEMDSRRRKLVRPEKAIRKVKPRSLAKILKKYFRNRK